MTDERKPEPRRDTLGRPWCTMTCSHYASLLEGATWPTCMVDENGTRADRDYCRHALKADYAELAQLRAREQERGR